MAFVKNLRVCSIIVSASGAAAGVGAGLAQFPGSDWVLIVPIQLSMITAIARAHGHALDKAAAAALLGTFTATIVGRTVTQAAIGWFPGVGNALNAATASAVTSAIGSAAHTYFETAGRTHASRV